MEMDYSFVQKSADFGDPAQFSTPGQYSMDAAIELLENLEFEYGCEVGLENRQKAALGKIVENGISVRYENIEFEIMCSYEDIFVRRKSGNKDKFFELCDYIKQLGKTSA